MDSWMLGAEEEVNLFDQWDLLDEERLTAARHSQSRTDRGETSDTTDAEDDHAMEMGDDQTLFDPMPLDDGHTPAAIPGLNDFQVPIRLPPSTNDALPQGGGRSPKQGQKRTPSPRKRDVMPRKAKTRRSGGDRQTDDGQTDDEEAEQDTAGPQATVSTVTAAPVPTAAAAVPANVTVLAFSDLRLLRPDWTPKSKAQDKYWAVNQLSQSRQDPL